MRKLLLVGVILGLGCVNASAGPKEEALKVLAKWDKAFSDSDVDAIVKLYAPDALFFGTGSKTVVNKSDDIRRYFEGALLTDRPRGAPLDDTSVMEVSDTVVVVAALNTSTRTKDGKIIGAPGRVTFVIAKRGDDWKVVHFHRSAMPQ